jgi:hypothetical protein
MESRGMVGLGLGCALGLGLGCTRGSPSQVGGADAGPPTLVGAASAPAPRGACSGDEDCPSGRVCVNLPEIRSASPVDGLLYFPAAALSACMTQEELDHERKRRVCLGPSPAGCTEDAECGFMHGAGTCTRVPGDCRSRACSCADGKWTCEPGCGGGTCVLRKPAGRAAH